MQTQRAMPLIEVADLDRSQQFYAALGFATLGVWGDPPGIAIFQRGSVSLMAFLMAAPVRNRHWAAYIYVDNAEAMHADIVAHTDLRPDAPVDQPYGCRDFEVTDPDGHRLAFGQDLNPAPPGPGLGPDLGRG